jgi:hypothetical protein
MVGCHGFVAWFAVRPQSAGLNYQMEANIAKIDIRHTKNARSLNRERASMWNNIYIGCLFDFLEIYIRYFVIVTTFLLASCLLTTGLSALRVPLGTGFRIGCIVHFL